MKKSIILTYHMAFALISTDFVHLGCNFTWSNTMHMKFFHILLTNLRNCFEKIYFSLRGKSRQKSREKQKVSLWGAKKIFLNRFWMFINKIWKNFMCIVVLHVKLQPKRTNSVEMRANSVWQVKIIDFFNVFFN